MKSDLCRIQARVIDVGLARAPVSNFHGYSEQHWFDLCFADGRPDVKPRESAVRYVQQMSPFAATLGLKLRTVPLATTDVGDDIDFSGAGQVGTPVSAVTESKVVVIA